MKKPRDRYPRGLWRRILSCCSRGRPRPQGQRSTTLALPATGMNHGIEVAVFALRCLTYALTHPERKRTP